MINEHQARLVTKEVREAVKAILENRRVPLEDVTFEFAVAYHASMTVDLDPDGEESNT